MPDSIAFGCGFSSAESAKAGSAMAIAAAAHVLVTKVLSNMPRILGASLVCVTGFALRDVSVSMPRESKRPGGNRQFGFAVSRIDIGGRNRTGGRSTEAPHSRVPPGLWLFASAAAVLRNRFRGGSANSRASPMRNESHAFWLRTAALIGSGNRSPTAAPCMLHPDQRGKVRAPSSGQTGSCSLGAPRAARHCQPVTELIAHDPRWSS